MKINDFAKKLFEGLEKENWGYIKPRLFKYIGDGISPEDVDKETWENIVSLREIIEHALEVAMEEEFSATSLPETTGKITAKDIIAELRYAWKEYGKYTYEDKGADEVIDVKKLADRLKLDHDADGIIEILKEVEKVKGSYELISSIIGSYDNDHELWEDLDDDFLAKYY